VIAARNFEDWLSGAGPAIVDMILGVDGVWRAPWEKEAGHETPARLVELPAEVTDDIVVRGSDAGIAETG